MKLRSVDIRQMVRQALLEAGGGWVDPTRTVIDDLEDAIEELVSAAEADAADEAVSGEAINNTAKPHWARVRVLLDELRKKLQP